MSLYIEFEPHSWYRGFAIKDDRDMEHYPTYQTNKAWYACTDDGNTYRIVEIEADTLRELREQITAYRRRKGELE